MADQIPDHRTTTAARSGDTHVIGEDGTARNIDAEAREAEAKAILSRPPAAESAGGTNAAASGDVMPPAGSAEAGKAKPGAKAAD
jgi:hypothetical protein